MASAKSRDEFIWYVLSLRSELTATNIKPVKFYFREEIELGLYSKNDDEKKMKLPPGEPIEMDAAKFNDWSQHKDTQKQKDIDETETVWSTVYTEKPLNEDDFEIIKTIGRGAFGKVNLCIKKDNQELYALKIMAKGDVISKDQIKAIKSEKDILMEMNHPFLVCLEFCFHSPKRIYFGMKFLQGGELFQYLRVKRRFSEENSKFYAAQILLALEYLHSKNIIYRDLKPENIMLDAEGYIRMVDFGVCKRLASADARTDTIVGTPEYLPPEIIIQKGHSLSADWWSFGIFM